MDKFYKLEIYLRNRRDDEFVLSFNEIEEILGFRLADSAYKYSAYWSPTSTHTLAVAILECGYKTSPDLWGKKVLFYKAESKKEIEKSDKERKIIINDGILFEANISGMVEKFTDVYNFDINGRYKSYDRIREFFIKHRKDESKRDLITLYLYAYLASWGMLRNSFLMQKDFLFSRPVVDVLCSDKYDCLLEFNPFENNAREKAQLIMELVEDIKKCYLGKEYFEEGSNKLKKINNVTDTLVTKIILGTVGCTIAYDTYAKKGLSSHRLSQSIGKKSIYELIGFAKANEKEISGQLSKLNYLYTPMKILDMYFFEKGFEIELK